MTFLYLFCTLGAFFYNYLQFAKLRAYLSEEVYTTLDVNSTMRTMENLSTKAILLDMTTDLSRVGNFALQDKQKRVEQFAGKLNEALQVLKERELSEKIKNLLEKIANLFTIIDSKTIYKKEFLADDAFTYGVMLSHKIKVIQ